MIIALTFVILLIATVAILILRMVRPGFAYYWLVAVAGALLIWPMILFTSIAQQSEINLPLWEPLSVFPSSPAFFVDQISWSFSLAIATLLLAGILISVSHSADPDFPRPTWLDYAGSLSLTAASILAVCVGNLLSLLLVWTLQDILELVAWLSKTPNEGKNQQVALTFSSRIVSQVVLIWAAITEQSSLTQVSIQSVDQAITPFIIIAAGIRICVQSITAPHESRSSIESGLGSALYLIPLASSLALLCRVATVGVPQEAASVLLVLTSLMALYGSAKWLLRINDPENRVNWIIALGAFSIAAAIRMQPGACLAIGNVLLLTGGLLFNFNIRSLKLSPLMIVGGLSLLALPWTPGWSSVQLYTTPFKPILILLLASQSLLFAGYIRYSLRVSSKPFKTENWAWALYIWGLVLLVLATLIITWWPLRNGHNPLQQHPSLLESWPGIAVMFLVGLIFFFWRGRYGLPARFFISLRKRLSFGWLYGLIWRLLRMGRYVMQWLNTLLEGQAGILWAFLLLVLLLTLLSQSILGG
jgi:hypothetical protein